MDQLLGGVFAALGIYKTVPLIHGSQGCASYVKSIITKHFKEPVEIATTGFYEVSAIYGGRDNLIYGIKNIVKNKQPDLVVVMTTGLSETIGEDIQGGLKKATEDLNKCHGKSTGTASTSNTAKFCKYDETKPCNCSNQNHDGQRGCERRKSRCGETQKRCEGKKSKSSANVVAVSTPSYVGTHINGYDNTLKEIIKALVMEEKNKTGRCGKGSSGKCNPSGRSNRINIIPGVVNPGDVREIKHICREMNICYTLLTDITSLDRPLRRPKEKFPECETTVDAIKRAPNSKATISFGIEGISGAKYLENFGVTSYNLKFPIGIENTDNFVKTLSEISGKEIPDSIWDERGYAIDAMVDANGVLRNRKVAIFGDPDKVIGLTDFAFEMGMKVIAVLSPTKTPYFTSEMERISRENDVKITVFENGDLYQLHKFIKKNPIDLIIGDYRGRYIANEEKIPLLRVGFPVIDRYGYHRKPMLGYSGALRIAEDAANLLVESSETYKTLHI